MTAEQLAGAERRAARMAEDLARAIGRPVFWALTDSRNAPPARPPVVGPYRAPTMATGPVGSIHR